MPEVKSIPLIPVSYQVSTVGVNALANVFIWSISLPSVIANPLCDNLPLTSTSWEKLISLVNVLCPPMDCTLVKSTLLFNEMSTLVVSYEIVNVFAFLVLSADNIISLPVMKSSVSSPSATNPSEPSIFQNLNVLFIRILATPADWNDTSNPESLSN